MQHYQYIPEKIINNKESVEEINILGFVIGSRKHIDSKVEYIHKEVTNIFDTIIDNIYDTQTIGQLVNNCLLSKFYYTLNSDVFANKTPSNIIFNHTSKNTSKIKDIVLRLCKLIASTDGIPAYVIKLASRLVSQNGTQIASPTRSTISSACTPLLKSIKIAKFGTTIGDYYKMPP